MSLKQFVSSATKWIPQSGFSASFTEQGGIEAQQDFRIRNSDLRQGSHLTSFQRGVTWETVWPEVPRLYARLTMKTFDPVDIGDGWSMLKVTFTGYQFSADESSGDETESATSSLVGGLENVSLQDHPKWEPLADIDKSFLGQQIRGEITMNPNLTLWGTYQEDSTSRVFVPVIDDDGNTHTPTGDALMFAKIIAQGDETYEKGGYTYTYHTESEVAFTPSQLNKIGKIVANPPGNPETPSAGWTWQLVSPNQTQSGLKRFTKSLDFKLIRDNEKNQFLYGE